MFYTKTGAQNGCSKQLDVYLQLKLVLRFESVKIPIKSLTNCKSVHTISNTSLIS